MRFLLIIWFSFLLGGCVGARPNKPIFSPAEQAEHTDNYAKWFASVF